MFAESFKVPPLDTVRFAEPEPLLVELLNSLPVVNVPPLMLSVPLPELEGLDARVIADADPV
jgi:hypothetical protein